MFGKLRAMDLGILVVGALEANCVVLWDEARNAVVVDPGADGEGILRFLADRHLTLAALWLTHGHFDHISALTPLLKTHAVPVYLHEDEVSRAFSSRNRFPPYYWTVPTKPSSLSFVHDGDALRVGTETLKVLHTPGHSSGSVCYYHEAGKLLLSGDTLFRGGAGRTDFPSGDASALRSSLSRLLALPGDTRVLPGHGSETTISAEKLSNPFHL